MNDFDCFRPTTLAGAAILLRQEATKVIAGNGRTHRHKIGAEVAEACGFEEAG